MKIILKAFGIVIVKDKMITESLYANKVLGFA